MTGEVIDGSRRQAARVVGLAYLLALVPAIFAELFARGRLIVADDAARTAMNIIAHQRLFRLGIASNLAVCAIDIALITALYIVLGPVHRRVALLATGWGLIETGVLVVATLSDFDVLRVLGDASYLKAFEPERLQAMARLSIGTHSAAYTVCLIFAGLRSTAFCSLWVKSRLVPRALAVWGIAASALMGACAFSFVVFPELANAIPFGLYGAPIFLFELTMGSWLVWKGLPPDPAVPAN